MLTLKPSPQLRQTSRLGYRFRRFLLSKTWWTMTRLVMPLAIIALIGFQLFTSQNIRDGLSRFQNGMVERVAFLPGLKIENLVIENATKLQEDEILHALDIQMPNSTLLLDREKLREKMASFDEIGESTFRFGFDGHLYVELKPRKPEMIFLHSGEMITVDKTGHKVERLSARSDRAELFVISGEGALDASDEAIKIIAALKPYASQIRGLVRVGARRWDVIFTNHARLMLPAEEPLLALSLALKSHQDNDVLNRNIEAYDLRDPKRPILRVKPEALEDMNALQGEDTGQPV